MFGWKTAKWAQKTLPQFKASCFRHCDKAIYRIPAGRAVTSRRADLREPTKVVNYSSKGRWTCGHITGSRSSEITVHALKTKGWPGFLITTAQALKG